MIISAAALWYFDQDRADPFMNNNSHEISDLSNLNSFDLQKKTVTLNSGYEMPIIVIPGFSNPEHIKENMDIFDFELTEEEMQRTHALERNEKHDWY